MLNKKKICIIVPTHISSKIGGAQMQADFITKALVHAGNNDVYFLAKSIDINFKPDGYKLINIAPFKNIIRGVFLLSIPKLYKTLKEIKPDYIYQRVGCTYTGVSAYYSKRHNCTSIWHVASDSDVSKNINLQRRGISQKIEQVIFEYGIKNIDMIVSQTKYQSDMLYSDYGRKATSIVPNFHPVVDECIEKNSVKNIIWIGNLKSVKRPELFVLLAKKLSGLINTRFIMLGEQSSDVRWQELFEIEINSIDNLEYLGRLDQASVNKILIDSHILVNTSKWEGFSNTFIEAWMREVPVVTLGINPDEVFTKNKIGYCAENLDDLVTKVRELISNDKLRDEFGNNAKLYSRDRHSIANVSKILNLLAC